MYSPKQVVYEYPLEHCEGLVEVIRDNEDKIDIEEETRVYHSFDMSDSEATIQEEFQRRYNNAQSSASRPSQSQKRSNSRAPSSMFSNDIWISEETDAQDTSFARGVRIVGWTNVGDKRGGAYVVYDCAITTSAGTTMHVHKRYNAFASLYDALMCTLPPTRRRHVPSLPPRAPWSRYRPGFLETRRRKLQAWLSGVLLHPEIGGCKVVREWVTVG